MFRILLSGVLALIPIQAMAFPVVVGSVTQSLLFLLLLGAGVSAYAAKRNKRLLVGCIFLTLIIAAHIISTNVAVSALSMKASKFQSEAYDPNKNSPSFVDINTAETLIKQQGFVPIQVSDKPMPSINGLNTFSPDNADKAELYANSKEANGIVLFSNYVYPAIDLAQRLNGFQENVFIVPTSKGTQFADGTFISHAYIDEFFNKQNNLGAPLDLPLNKVSEVPLSVFNETKANLLSRYNVIVAGGDDLLNTHIPYGSKVASIPHLLLMDDKEWKSVAKGFDADKPTVISFTIDIHDRQKKLFSAYALKQLMKHTGIDKLTYTLSADFQSLLPPLPTDNYLTPYHHNADRHMSPTTFYAMQRHQGEITTLCFTKNCTDRLPPNTSSFGTTLIDTDKVFSFNDYMLDVNTSSIDKSKPIAIVLEDASSSLLGYFLAHELAKEGSQFVGFTSLYGGVFGGTYNNPLMKGTNNEFYYDDFRVRIDVAIQEFLLSTTPHTPIELNTSLWLVAFGVLLGLLISIPVLPKVIRYSAMFCAAYFTFYGTLWVQAPINEYQTGIIPNIFMALVMGAVMTFRSTSTMILRLKLLFLVNSSFSFVFVTLALMPILDRFYYGLTLSMLAVLLCAVNLNRLPKKIGSKYKLTAPFVNGNKGFLIEMGKQPSVIQLLFSKNWIIRSNHLSELESNAGGLFESRVVHRKNVHTNLAYMFSAAKNKQNLKASEVQFWLMPYKEYMTYGCAESHYGGFSSQCVMAIGERDEVSTGQSSVFTLFSRKEETLNLTERRVLKALREVEKYFGCPVSIEFGLTNAHRLDILQVRKADLHPSADPSALKVAREQGHKLELVDKHAYKPLSESVLHELYNKQVVVSNGEVLRLPSKPKPFDAEALEKCLLDLKLIADNNDLIANGSFSHLVNEVSRILKPVTNLDTSIVETETYRWFIGAWDVIELSQKLCNKVGGTPESFELSDSSFEASDDRNYMEVTKRDAIRAVMLYGVAILKKAVHEQGICHSVSIDGLTKGKSRVTRPSTPSNDKSNNVIVVVSGEMPEQIYSIDEIELIPVTRLKRCTLVCDYVPNSKMMIIGALGGLVCRTGTPLSHAAITAKHYKIPMTINPNI